MKIEDGATRPDIFRVCDLSPGQARVAPAAGQLHARIVDQIGLRIVRGELKPGDPLPDGASWAAALGVSRTAFRESIKVLAGKGMIEARPRTGMRVRARKFWNHLDPDILAWRFGAGGDAEATDLFDLRRMVEPAAAELAAARASEMQIAELAAAYAAMEAVGDDDEAFVAPDLRFHQLILGMTGNELISSLAALIETALVTSFRLSNDNPAGQRPSLPLHRAVLSAIRERDGKRAREAMTALLAGAEQDVRKAAATRRRGRHG